MHTAIYESPIGLITIESDEEALTGLWIEGQRHTSKNAANTQSQPTICPEWTFSNRPVKGTEENEGTESASEIIKQTCKWLDIYFTGKEPSFMPPVRLSGTTFQLAVWRILQRIPYGTTITYGDIATKIANGTANQGGKTKMSARAVGRAVGSNPISIIVPCHRVIGVNDRLTGYQGGIALKVCLLGLEGLETSTYQ